jgi:hypothetical protein
MGECIGVEGLRARKTDALLRVHLVDGRVLQAEELGGPMLTYWVLSEAAGLRFSLFLSDRKVALSDIP